MKKLAAMSDADPDRDVQLSFICLRHFLCEDNACTDTREHAPSYLTSWEHTDAKVTYNVVDTEALQHTPQPQEKSPRCRISTFQPRHKLDIMSLIEVEVIAGMFYWIARERAGDVLSLMRFFIDLVVPLTTTF